MSHYHNYNSNSSYPAGPLQQIQPGSMGEPETSQTVENV